MAPRPYDRRRRDEAMAATRARIVAAIVALHAEVGPTRASYAMIARRADVAIPTVYKHFPDLAGMFAACIGHVSAEVPALGLDLFAKAKTAAERFAVLVPALFERHRRFAPWLRWSRREAHLLPDMAVYFTRMRERHLQLIRAALEPAHGARTPRALVAVVEALTGFDAWQTLTAENGLSSDEAADAAVDAVTAVVRSDAYRGGARRVLRGGAIRAAAAARGGRA